VTSVRRAVLLAFLLLGGLVVAAGPVAAAEAVHVTGSWTSTGSVGGSGCSGPGQLRQDVDGEGDLEPLGDATFTIGVCFTTEVPSPVPGTGTFSLATAEGTLSGTVAAKILSSGAETFVEYDVAVSRGTGRFCDATGDLTVFGVFATNGTTGSGTLSGDLALATSSK
jgi:hypothetical protein